MLYKCFVSAGLDRVDIDFLYFHCHIMIGVSYF